MSDVVYILTNAAMPGLVKIGKTKRDDPSVRMAELYTTGVPVPFVCVKAIRVEDAGSAEKALHTAFEPYRINSKREFFEIDSIQASILLELLEGKDVEGKDATSEVNAQNKVIDETSLQAEKNLSSRRPQLNFEEMSIPVGSMLCYVESDDEAKVIGSKKVKFREEVMSLTRATRILRDTDYNSSPKQFWRYKGELLTSVYNKTYVDVG